MTHLAHHHHLANYAWHGALGYDFLALLVVRLVWRWLNPVPSLPADLKPWERYAAHIGHAGLYVLMFATTVVGWGLAGTMRAPLQEDLFGFTVPLIYASPHHATHELFEDVHCVLAYLLAALVVVHILGALRHHFIKRTTILRRMTIGNYIKSH
jgi:cytochrome b561